MSRGISRQQALETVQGRAEYQGLSQADKDSLIQGTGQATGDRIGHDDGDQVTVINNAIDFLMSRGISRQQALETVQGRAEYQGLSQADKDSLIQGTGQTTGDRIGGDDGDQVVGGDITTRDTDGSQAWGIDESRQHEAMDRDGLMYYRNSDPVLADDGHQYTKDEWDELYPEADTDDGEERDSAGNLIVPPAGAGASTKDDAGSKVAIGSPTYEDFDSVDTFFASGIKDGLGEGYTPAQVQELTEYILKGAGKAVFVKAMETAGGDPNKAFAALMPRLKLLAESTYNKQSIG